MTGREDGAARLAPGDFATRIAAGDRSAEAEFVQRYERGVRALVRRHTRPGEPQVDDIVQDVLRAVLEKLREGALRDVAALPAYVQQAVVFATAAEYRKRKRRAEDGTIEPDAVLASPSDPVAHAEAGHLARVVRALLAELTVVRDRELLRRFYVEEESKEQVCRELGIDPGHFHRVTHRARGRLRELLLRAGIDGT